MGSVSGAVHPPSVLTLAPLEPVTDLRRCPKWSPQCPHATHPWWGKGVRSCTSPPRQGRQSVVPGGRESARLFVSRSIFEALLVGRISTFSQRALRKRPQGGSQKVSNRAGDCGDCGDCGFIGRYSLINLPRKPQSPQSPQSPARFFTFWTPLFGRFLRTVLRNV